MGLACVVFFFFSATLNSTALSILNTKKHINKDNSVLPDRVNSGRER